MSKAYGGKGGGPIEIRGPAENRVYVGNLSWNVTWRELKDHMKKVGEVAFCDVMMEAGGRSRGCGLVAYRSAEDAERAVQELHDSELMGRTIFVREDREPSGGPGAAKQDRRVYIGNLAWSVTWKDLKDHCRSVGEVVRADVIAEGNVESGRSKGYGIVEFSTPEEAQAAVEELTDTEIHGRRIFLREDRETGRPMQVAEPWGWTGGGGSGKGDYGSYKGGGKGYGGSGKGGGKWDVSAGFEKVFVGNLPFECTWQELKDHMRPVGEIVHVEIMTVGGETGGTSKGCAVVEFATFGAARRAVERLHDSMLGGRMILVREYVDQGDSGKGAVGKGKSASATRQFKVLVTGLASNITWQVLKDHMRSAGDVSHVALTPRGGVVTYSASSLAKRAVERLSGSTLDGQVLTVRETTED